jgi:hypothetical protein
MLQSQGRQDVIRFPAGTGHLTSRERRPTSVPLSTLRNYPASVDLCDKRTDLTRMTIDRRRADTRGGLLPG